jgi:hypothetical protein
MEAGRRYRESVLRYFDMKKVYGSYLWFTPIDPKTFMSASELIAFTTNGRFASLEKLEEWWDTSKDPFSIFVRSKPVWNERGPVLDVSDAPQFIWRVDTVGNSMVKSASSLGGMAFGMLVLFFLSFISFIRFDVR